MKLLEKHINQLLTLSETGQGYQIVDVELKDGMMLKGLMVYNAEELVINNKYKPEDIQSIKITN